MITAASAGLLAFLLAYLPTVAQGQWQGDEYDYAANLRDHGIGFTLHRVAYFGPRPVSELFIWLYAELINATHKPWIGTFTAFGWGASLLIAFAGFLTFRTQAFLPRIFLALCLASLFLLGHPVADFLYWPMGMIAYLPTVAGLCALTLLILDGHLSSRSGRNWAMAALLVAAGSSEVGAMAVLCFGSVMFCWAIRSRAPWLWLVPPLAMICFVFYVIFTGRAAAPPTLPSPTGHHLFASLTTAAWQFGRDLLVVHRNDLAGGFEGDGLLRAGTKIKLLILAGFILLARQCFARPPFWPSLILLASLLFAIFASIVSAYYQFGFLCCQRHESVRQCLEILALLTGAALVAPALPAARAVPAAILCLGLAMAPMLAWRIPSLALAWRAREASAASRTLTWQTGLGPGERMLFSQPDAPLIHRPMFPPGDHLAGPTQPWDIYSLLRFFQKRDVRVLSAPVVR